MMTCMEGPSIAPPAQRLAEANNVDWRALRGSGDGGSVVERDVLEYLARVMRGEEATDPTPEPLPEGLSAWHEEPVRRRGVATSPFTVPVATPSPKKEVVASPWTFSEPEAPPRADVQREAFTVEAGALEPQAADAAAVEWAGSVSHSLPNAPPAGVPEADYEAALEELRVLKARLAGLEEERLQHVNELHQLSRMQETIALQRGEHATGALQSELEELRERVQGEAQRAEALEAQNRDLEARLVRARAFKSRARTEFERLLVDKAALESELAALKKRPRWRWGKAS